MGWKPKSIEVDLTELQDNGVLMAANERFFWPLGLALGWEYDAGQASRLHVREWDYGDGHQENIGLEPGDEIAAQRREAFLAWSNTRAGLMPDKERDRALAAAAPPAFGVVVPTNVAPEHKPEPGSF